MPKFVIERELDRSRKTAAAGTAGDLAEIMRRAARDGSADPVDAELRHRRQDLLHLHRARRRGGETHARKGGFPANVIARVRTVIDPTRRSDI